MPNRLAQETSPYLLQHAENPVDWYPWGEEALQAAKDADKPIFLSIGYSACHWCHVMEHESFESPEIAALLNERFIAIKVDREERPDLDQIYMNAVQMLTGHGGWPMSVFLTPETKPFYGGTYWPATSSRGMPGFDQVLNAVSDAWKSRREMAVEQSHKLTAQLQAIGGASAEVPGVPSDIAPRLLQGLQSAFDRRDGGFGGAPKFPQTMNIEWLMRRFQHEGNTDALEMVRHTLTKMAQGGIYDHLGGGFSRYSVDAQWLVPHFEKMLYDNGLLVSNFVEAYRLTGDADYATVIRETCDYILRDMTDERGGFHSSEDADSEGEEGKFYVWSQAEILDILGQDDGAEFCEIYRVTPEGNFEGANILNLAQSIDQHAAALQVDPKELHQRLRVNRDKLLDVRSQRIRPAKDDKILTSWNGLMIAGMAKAGAALGDTRYLGAAEKAANFLLSTLRDENGRLLHGYRHGRVKHQAYLDDYAYLADALLALYESTLRHEWLEKCVELVEEMILHFEDRETGGFYFTADDHEQLITRNKDFYDHSVPSGNGLAACLLAKLGRLLDRDDYLEKATNAVAAAGQVISQSPSAATQALIAHDMLTHPGREIAIVAASQTGELTDLLVALQQKSLLNAVVALKLEDQPQATLDIPWLADKTTGPEGETRIYICENYTCQAPLTVAQFLEL
ncbi:MAG: thioredoxin domain-containing protein [Pirellulaceae bacterium]